MNRLLDYAAVRVLFRLAGLRLGNFMRERRGVFSRRRKIQIQRRGVIEKYVNDRGGFVRVLVRIFIYMLRIVHGLLGSGL